MDQVHQLDPESPLVYGREWHWRSPSRGEHFRRCSYCGSINPEDLAAETPMSSGCQICRKPSWQTCLQAQDHPHDGHIFTPDGWYASWADWKYGWPHKFYVDIPNRDPNSISVLSVMNHAPQGQEIKKYVHTSELTDQQRTIVREEGYFREGVNRSDSWFMFTHREKHHAKFYTAHLADSDISADAKAIIERVSGLCFTFYEDGRVSWSKHADT